MKKVIFSTAFALIPIVGGILLIALPDKAVMLAFLILSFFMIWSGVKNLWYSVSFTLLPKGVRSVGIVKNIVSIVIGALMVWKAVTAPSDLMSFAVYVIASYLLVTAAIDTVDTVFMRKLGLSNGIGGDALLNLVFAIILFLFPRLIGSTFLTIIGIILIVVGSVMMTGAINGFRMDRALRKMAPGKDEPIDVEYEEK